MLEGLWGEGFPGTGADGNFQKVDAEVMFQIQAVLNAVQDGVVLIDTRGHIQCFNSAAETIFGYTEGELIGHNVSVLMTDADRAAHDLYMQAYLSGGEAKVIGRLREMIGQRRDGTAFPMELTVTPIERLGRKVFVGVVRDLTDRKRMEAEQALMRERAFLTQKMEAIGTLAGGVTHDLGNILNSVLACADAVLAGLPADSEQARLAEEMIRAGMRGRDVIGRLMAFCRDDTGEREPIDMAQIVIEASSLLRFSGEDRIRTEVTVSGGPHIVEGNAAEIYQLVMNLCLNAFHSMEGRGGRIDVSLDTMEVSGDWPEPAPADTARSRIQIGQVQPGRFARLTVRDCGGGITPAVLARIFEPFFTTKSAGKGTGLGLSTVHCIVNAYGGALAVETELGVGSEFQVILPEMTFSEAGK